MSGAPQHRPPPLQKPQIHGMVFRAICWQKQMNGVLILNQARSRTTPFGDALCAFESGLRHVVIYVVRIA